MVRESMHGLVRTKSVRRCLHASGATIRRRPTASRARP